MPRSCRFHLLIFVLLVPLAVRAAGADSRDAVVNQVAEITLHYDCGKADPFWDVELAAVIAQPGGRQVQLPAFWAGGDVWKVRFTPNQPGLHHWRALLLKGPQPLPAIDGDFNARPYQGENPLYKHGPVQLSANKRYFAHADGTPFFWLADSWWHGMTARLTQDGFKTLVADRSRKGFTVIQFAIAFPCDIEPFDPRGDNEAGPAWTPQFKTINPAYWDLVDKRVASLVDHGLMPSIVGAWGYYINFAGVEKMKKHWRYIIARYGAYPVAWTICGESRLPWYLNIGKGDQGYQQTFKWTEVGRDLRQADPFHRLVGIHPGPDLWFFNAAYPALRDFSIVDIFFGMGGHGNMSEYQMVASCLKAMEKFRGENPGKVALIGELCWEGMYGGGCGPQVQRLQFWSSILNGAPGHCYGTDSLWQMNTRERPFGPSPMGTTWGNWPWEEACQWPGSTQVGIGKRILEKYEWWRFEPHPEWLSGAEEKDGSQLNATAAGIPGQVRVIYLARKRKCKLAGLEVGSQWNATFISPIDGREYPVAQPVIPDADGAAAIPNGPINQDWVLALTPQNARKM